MSFLLILGLISAEPSFAESTPQLNSRTKQQKLRIHDPQVAAQLAQTGGLIADYSSFQVVRVDTATATKLVGRAGVEDLAFQDVIELNTGALDTTTPEIQALRHSLNAPAGKGLHLVQFAGPIKREWLEGLQQSGVQVVTYVPQNAYLVYGELTALSKMQTWAAATATVQWEGAYLDDYKIHPRARTADAKGEPRKPETTMFAIQMVADPEANAGTLQLIDTLKLEPIRQQYSLLNYLNVVVRLPAERLPDIAARPEVISIQPYLEPVKMDERQDQILAANLTGTGPTGPGYLAWLASKGFTQGQFTTSGFAVDMSDSGIDNGTTSPGHFGLYTSGDTTQPGRVVYNRLVGTPNAGSTIQGCDGHGNLNTHIVAGFNDQPAGFPHTDSEGFHYGLGVCPFVRVGSSVVFDPDTFTSPNYAEIHSRAYNDGARISGNSWGANVSGAYTTDSQSYDALVRDAQPSGSPFPAAGNQQMVIVFAAGNAGSGSGTVGSPGTAKNVFTIGASENVCSMTPANGGNDASGNDGCALNDTGADNANDIATFSSRGPCTDGRTKPDLVAPGTHITGGVGQISPPPLPSGTGSALACFKGSGVCALNGGGTIGSPDNFFPLNQQFFTESSGTSHSTPAVAGSCALLRQYFINTGLTPPSPAMTKAYLMNSTRYLNGAGANDSLFSNSQGMGEVNLAMAFDGTARILHDQIFGEKFTATGQTRTYAATVVDTSKPVRVTLAWTDAPGNTTGNAYNNDLDLTVTIGGNIYEGNVFSGPTSITGGAADSKNNVESVFLPPGTSGNFVVTVTAANINSDGVPNEAPSLDQDYALVIYNANPVAGAAVVGWSATLLAEDCSPANGLPDPGETVTYSFSLGNIGTTDTTNLVATLLTGNGVGSPSGPQTYGVLTAGGTNVSQSFTFTVIAACGDVITPTLHLQDGPTDLGTVAFPLQSGQFISFFTESFDAVIAPGLPPGWTTTSSGAQSLWITSGATNDSPPDAAFSPDPSASGMNELVSPVINLPDGPIQLSFRNNYNLESTYDGGVLEISINGGLFSDILTAGGSFLNGGYSGTLSSGDALGSRRAWTGNSGGFITTLVALPAAASGQSIQLKWRCGTDSSVGYTGWYIDTVALSTLACCNNSPIPIPVFSASPRLGGAPLAVTFSDSSTGIVTNRFWDFGDGNTMSTTLTNLVFTYTNPGSYTVSLTVSGPDGTNTSTRASYITATNPVPALIAASVAPVVVIGGNGNGQVDPNECNELTLAIRNAGTGPATNISATLSTTTPGVTILQGNSSYPDVAAGATGTNTSHFRIQTSPAFVCGTLLNLTLALTYGGGGASPSFNAPVGSTGYRITTSTGAAIVPGTTDIGNHFDDGTTTISLPFSFAFYGQNFTNATLSSNGNLQFNTATTAYANACLPASGFTDAIFPHWDDLRTDSSGSGIFASISGVAPNRIFNIEWRATYYNPSGVSLNFELRLYEGQPRMDFIYGNLNGTGSSATVGIQHGSTFTSFECNSNSLSPGLQLTLQPGSCPDGGGPCIPPTPTILPPLWDGSTLTFSFATTPGFTYDVQYKNSLDDAVWQTLQSVPGTGAVIPIRISTSTPSKRFYRLYAH